MAEPRAVIDIVRSEAGAHELLEQIGLFVGTFGGAEARKGVCAALLADALQRTAGEIERLIPGRLAEHRQRIGGIHREVRRLVYPGFADQRLGQALRMMRVIEAEAPLDTEPFVVGRSIAALDPHDVVVGDVIR